MNTTTTTTTPKVNVWLDKAVARYNTTLALVEQLDQEMETAADNGDEAEVAAKSNMQNSALRALDRCKADVYRLTSHTTN